MCHDSNMVITLLRSYPSLHKEGALIGKRKLDKNGNPITVFVYQVTGKDEDLKKYEEVQTKAGVKTVKDVSGHLWFTTSPVGEKGTLKISTNGKVFADTTALDLAQAMSRQFPGQLGLDMAKNIIAKGFVAQDSEELEQHAPDLHDLEN